MANQMAYNRANPDPTSVAAFIARHYRVYEGVHNAELSSIYNSSYAIAEELLAGKTNVSIQDAMDMVELARTGKKRAKYIPQTKHQSVTARKVPKYVEPRCEGVCEEAKYGKVSFAESAAFYITRYYKVKEGIHGETLAAVYNTALQSAKALMDIVEPKSIQRAIDLVENARIGEARAYYVPVSCSEEKLAWKDLSVQR